MADIVQKSSLLFLEIENCVAKTAFFTAVHSYTLPYIMHFMHLCYAKEAWWKEFHHWEMEIQLPLLLLPVVISAAGGAALRTGGKSPSVQSCWTHLLGLFIFYIPLLCNRGLGRKTLMKDIHYLHSIFLTVSVHISWPCTFWAYCTSLYCSTFYSQLLILQDLQTVVFLSLVYLFKQGQCKCNKTHSNRWVKKN